MVHGVGAHVFNPPVAKAVGKFKINLAGKKTKVTITWVHHRFLLTIKFPYDDNTRICILNADWEWMIVIIAFLALLLKQCQKCSFNPFLPKGFPIDE